LERGKRGRKEKAAMNPSFIIRCEKGCLGGGGGHPKALPDGEGGGRGSLLEGKRVLARGFQEKGKKKKRGAPLAPDPPGDDIAREGDGIKRPTSMSLVLLEKREKKKKKGIV